MEGCGADDAIEGVGKREIQEIGGNHLGSRAELRLQVFAGRSRHVLRNVERDHPSVGQSLEQIRRQAAGAGTSVENQFVASQLQTGENFLAPTDLWLREAMVFGGVPFAGGI